MFLEDLTHHCDLDFKETYLLIMHRYCSQHHGIHDKSGNVKCIRLRRIPQTCWNAKGIRRILHTCRNAKRIRRVIQTSGKVHCIRQKSNHNRNYRPVLRCHRETGQADTSSSTWLTRRGQADTSPSAWLTRRGQADTSPSAWLTRRG